MSSYKEYLLSDGEKKWQDRWLDTKIDQAEDFGDKPKKYVLDMFPYPSGAGLHVGHPEGYTATDIYSRYWRLKGFNVLHPIGWDAFGLPAENYAIKTGTQPSITTAENVATFRRQIQSLGFSYDWDREINTTDPKYFKWTQWIFLQLFKKGLAYEAVVPINWCPSCKTGLANEEVKDGKCDRCGTQVEKKDLRQWMLKITAYADRLLDNIDAYSGIPSFTQATGDDAFRPNEPVSERWPVVCIVKHWSEDKYLCADWKALKWHGFVIGGIEAGESPAQAAAREITEETGYKNVRFMRELGRLDSRFYQVVKGQNRLAHFTVAYLELIDGETVDVEKSEKEIQDFNWISRAEVGDLLDRDDMKYAWGLHTGTQKQEIKPLLDWPNSIKALQKNWIGKSQGINFKQKIKDTDIEFEVYDSIPQTFLAQTFTVIAPEHPLVEKLIAGTEYEKPVREFVKKIEERKLANKFDLEKEMEGIFTGRYVENPFGAGDLPLWIASYVIADYGTGIVNCSAHDERDFAFAKKYGIPMQVALLPKDAELAEKVKNLEVFYREPDGIMQSPEEVKGMSWTEAREPVINYIESKGFGRRATQYKLRDWVFSRQRYWGEPIPLVHCDKCGIVPLDEKDLPLTLPEVEKYEPTGTGESPLAAIDEWVNTTCPKCGGPAKRETNTMPQWAGSSWYWLRYIDPHNDKVFADQEKLKYWLPVDLYLGGAEHAVLHLLYARFWNMVLFDLGVVPQEEPFAKLVNQGLILGEDNEKMSKSRGNVVNPDDIIKEYGADTFRLYEMFMGPLEDMKPWSTKNILGVHRFLGKMWDISQQELSADIDEEVEVLLHKTIKKVGEDVEIMGYNTAISAMMVLVNKIQEKKSLTKNQLEKFLVILSPFAPHMAEELWSQLGHKASIFKEKWPEYDASKVVDSEIEMPIQVNGKVRSKLRVAIDIAEAEAVALAKQDENVKKYLTGEPKKVIFIKGKMISFVI